MNSIEFQYHSKYTDRQTLLSTSRSNRQYDCAFYSQPPPIYTEYPKWKCHENQEFYVFIMIMKVVLFATNINLQRRENQWITKNMRLTKICEGRLSTVSTRRTDYSKTIYMTTNNPPGSRATNVNADLVYNMAIVLMPRNVFGKGKFHALPFGESHIHA